MSAVPSFDSLGYFEKLKGVGFTDEQAKVQVSAMQDFVKSYDESSRKELATKGDIKDLRLEIEKVRYDLLKWYIGGWVAMAAIMAKGFHWFGF